MWIADTTMLWAAKWLYFYELWHFDGVWRGGGVGPATIAEARTAAVHGSSSERTKDPKEEVAVARG